MVILSYGRKENTDAGVLLQVLWKAIPVGFMMFALIFCGAAMIQSSLGVRAWGSFSICDGRCDVNVDCVIPHEGVLRHKRMSQKDRVAPATFQRPSEVLVVNQTWLTIFYGGGRISLCKQKTYLI